MTSSDPQQPGDGTYDPTAIRPVEPSQPAPDLTKRDGDQNVGGDPDAATTVHPAAQPDPYAAPSAYTPPVDPYAAPADPYAAQQNPYGAPANPYAAPPQYPGQQQYGQQQFPGQPFGGQPGYPAYPGQQPGYGGYPGYPQPQQTGTNGLAIASLSTGIIAFPFSCIPLLGYGSVFLAIAAIVMGVIAMKQTKQTGQQGRGMAIAGVVLGGVYLALFVIGLIFGIAYIASDGFGSGSNLLLALLS